MDPNAHQHLRFFLELLSFVGNFIVAVVAAVALYQIILAKRSIGTANQNLKLAADALETARSDIELRSKREAVTLAADRCAAFADKIPECAASLNAIVTTGTPIKTWILEDTRFSKSSIKDWDAAKQWLDQLQPPQRDQASSILNLLESFAMYFAEGAADERVAYSSVGPVFCSYVDRLAPYLILLRAKEAAVASGAFQNIVTLYEVWTSRMKRHMLESERRIISAKLSGIDTSDIPPIGTKRSSMP
jgi:hypothetical protein